MFAKTLKALRPTRNFVFASPRKYVQGAGALNDIGKYLAPLGSNALLMADNLVWGLTGNQVSFNLDAAKVKFHYEPFNGEASAEEITRIAELGKSNGTNVVVGLGGGKTLDTAKAVADELKQKVAIVPTVASTDAPCSALSVIYKPDGSFETYRFYENNPDLVLLDTAVAAKAPPRLFASGISDGLATYIEAKSIMKVHSTSMLHARPTVAGLAISRACEETLLTYGYSAYEAVKKQLVTPAVESVAEANTLLSGLGFENGGLAAAHAIHDGFTAIHGDVHKLTHGEKVTYGTLTQMVLDSFPDEEIAKYVRFYRSIKMPTTLEEMHLDKVSYDDLIKIAIQASSKDDTLIKFDLNLTPSEVANAILAVDAFSKTVQ